MRREVGHPGGRALDGSGRYTMVTQTTFFLQQLTTKQ
jgi:hypothetical protein